MKRKEMIKWILEQFKAMGATWFQLKYEYLKMRLDSNHLNYNMWLLGV